MRCFLRRCGLVLIVLFAMCRGGSGLLCYQCSTISNVHGCYSYDLRREFLRECEPRGGQRPVCRSLSQVQLFTTQQEVTVIRECAYVYTTTPQCLKSKFTNMHYSLSCECEQDGCNHAGSRTKNWKILSLMSICALVIK